MNKTNLTSSYDASGVDRMINEGLGGGSIHYEYDKRILELNRSPFKYKTNHMKKKEK